MASLRWREAALLVPACMLAVAASAAVAYGTKGRADFGDLAGALALAACFAAAHLALSARRWRADQVLLPTVASLMGLGLAINQRLAPDLAARQSLWLCVGVVALGGAALLPYRLSTIRRYRYSLAVVGLGLVAATLVAGSNPVPGGPPLWIRVAGLSFQPAEALKLLLVLFLAAYLDDKQELLASTSSRLGPVRLPPLPYLAPLAVMLGLSLALLAVQGDLGAALLLFAIGLAMLYLASGRMGYVSAGLGLFGMGAWALLARMSVVQTRIAIWRDPWSDASDAGYQLIQSLMALGAGGATGTGLAQGLPTAIPAVHTDFVYSALAEELGLAGVAAVTVLYVILALRGYRIAVTAATSFRAILAAGLTVALTLQALIIIGGVVRLVPLTGITLPFLSHGGTSVLTSALAVGLLLRIDQGAGR